MPWTIEFVANDRASAMIILILDKYKTELTDLLMVVMNYPLLTLKVLSYYKIADFKLDFMNHINASNLPAWEKIIKYLE